MHIWAELSLHLHSSNQQSLPECSVECFEVNHFVKQLIQLIQYQIYCRYVCTYKEFALAPQCNRMTVTRQDR